MYMHVCIYIFLYISNLSAVRKNKVMPFIGEWIQSQVNHIKPIKSAQKDGIMYLLICVERENHTCTHRSRTIKGNKEELREGGQRAGSGL